MESPDQVQLQLDYRSTRQLLEILACRLLGLEHVMCDRCNADLAADAVAEAIELRPLYDELRQRALRQFGPSILHLSADIEELEALPTFAATSGLHSRGYSC